MKSFSSLFGQRSSPPVDKRGALALSPTRTGGDSPAPIFRSKTLQQFLSVACAQPAAEFLDLGPVIGTNISFLGERVGCKIHVENLYADLDRHAQKGTLDQLPEFLASRLTLADESIDAVLGWDVFDYLDIASANVLAGELMRVLRPGGALLVFFGTTGPNMCYVKYVIQDEEHLRYHVYPAAASRQRVLQNREIIKLFDGLRVFDTVLLKSGAREMVFQKPT